MNSEKVKEIKKDIEICMKSLNCNGCSHHSQRSGECCRNLTNDILTYINEMESENERLRKERDVWVGKKIAIAERPKTKESIVAPIYVMPNVETPAMMLKLGEKNLLQQFAERLKEKMCVREYMGVKYKQGVFSENEIDETLKEFGL